jgi:nitrogen fixation/metabolism regulation signal transduction histidine kinase
LQHKLASELSEPSAKILKRSTRTIVQQVEAMKSMVDDFSEYARPSKKQVKSVDLNKLANDVIALYMLQPEITIEVQSSLEHLMVEVDQVSIHQVLHNLIKNAQEAMDGKGIIQLKLGKVLLKNTVYAELGIYDNGCGLNAEQIEKIFEPYVTTKVKGTGLGLAIVKKIIEEHGGVIWVDTTYNKGAGFVIQLPTI